MLYWFKNNKKIGFYSFIFFLVFIIILLVAGIYLLINQRLNLNQGVAKSICWARIEKIVQGDSMEPMFKNGEETILLENYYKCGNLIEKGDIIAYNYGGSENPLIKIVWATDRDEVKLAGDKLEINREILKNSAGQEFIFKESELKMLSLYIENKHIPKNSFLIFGDNINDSTDSRKFGAVSDSDFLGKFVTP